ncbi:MAG: ribosome small subunit-dependent GTPase A [Candidatus Krumholzibacteriota bacterium]|nr:ribosome small subunit-dependent GTPase A [Candidatus Krumholzibacteriota bacterium]
MKLSDLGWDRYFEEEFKPFQDMGFSAMRISRENRGKYIAYGEQGEYACEISGKFRFETASKGGFPSVGDWVAVSERSNENKATIHGLVPRKNAFSRKVAGEVTDEQVIAANLDYVFIVTGLDLNFNLRRIERYLSVAWESGAVPVILLNKSDLCPDAEDRKNEVESIALEVDVHAISASQNLGMEILGRYISAGRTVAFLGSSGVGKSTIINTLLGTDRLEVREVSDSNSKGRHTTTFRELIILPNGGMVIDTPGMRELQVWGDEEGLKHVFDDIEELALDCRFRDCSHGDEPGCAVQKAINNNILSPERFESYLKLKREYGYLAKRQSMKASAVEKEKWKEIKKFARELKKKNKDR